MEQISPDEMLLYLRGDAILLHRDHHGRILRCLTKKARDYFGFGTRWGHHLIIHHGQCYLLNAQTLRREDVRDILNDWEALQEILVKRNHVNIDHIRNPSEEIQKLAVQINGKSIVFIDNPSEEVKAIARVNTKRTLLHR